MTENNIAIIKNLHILYETDDGIVNALNGIDLNIKEGQTLGLVGETGAGKTTLAKSIMGLIPNPPGKILEGEIIYKDKDLLSMTKKEWQKIKGEEISMIFQDPMTSLNPVMTVGKQIEEVLEEHKNLNKSEIVKLSNEMLETVGISSERANDYPHQFSGGMKQRIVIAIALACNPKLLIADEPTTALDVTIQRQVLELMRNLKKEFNTSMLLITHDLGVVAQNCDYVAIIYAGEIIEYGKINNIFSNFKHPYTEGLFGSIPSLTVEVDRLNPIKGMVPDPTNLPSGCKFHPRCSYAIEECKKWDSRMYDINEDHKVRCIRYKKSKI